MFQGGIPFILDRVESTNKNVSLSALTALSHLVCSPTVRALISELLPLHAKKVAKMVSFCSSNDFHFALGAVQTLCMLYLNPSNHYILRQAKALEPIESFISRDPGTV